MHYSCLMNNVKGPGPKTKEKTKKGKTQKRECQNVIQTKLNWNDSFLK